MTDEKEDDPLMAELATSAIGLGEKFAESGEHALVLLGAKYLRGEAKAKGKGRGKGEPADLAIKIFFTATGDLDLIASGFYNELRHQLESGDPALFYVLRDVLLDLSEDLEIPLDDYPIDLKNDQRALH